MKNKILLSALLVAASSTSAIAEEKYDASILSMEGNVLVNQGESYRTATPGMNLKEFDRVMIMDGAKLSMQYPDGCAFTFKDSQIIQVGTTSACAMAGTGFVSATSDQYAEVAPGAAPNEEDEDKSGGIIASSGGSGAMGWTAGLTLTAYALYIALRDDDLPQKVTPLPPVIKPPLPVSP